MKKHILQNELLRQVLFDEQPQEEMEQGQLLLILAASMIALLVGAGLAIDGGVLFVRRAQLARAIDSAALSGVVELYDNIPATDAVDKANARAEQVFALNNVPIIQANGTDGNSDTTDCWSIGDTQWGTHDLCGTQNPGSVPGAIRYKVRVQWESNVFFMRLLGFEEVPLYADAEAEYYPVVDIYASGTQSSGVVKSSNQAVFGPFANTNFGDAYSSIYTDSGNGNQTQAQWEELRGRYTYRIQIPASYVSSYSTPLVRVEIYDPETYNCLNADCENTPGYTRNGSIVNNSCNNESNPCIFATGEDVDGGSPYWFNRVEEFRNGEWTDTTFRLYYFRENSDGTLEQVDVAYYEGRAGDPTTDLTWVSPTNDTTQLMPNPVLMLEELGYTVGLLADGPGTYDYYQNATNPELLCTDDGNGNGLIDDFDPVDGVSDDRRCFFADTDRDGTLNRNASEDREPQEAPLSCTATATSAIWGASGGAALQNETYYPGGVSEVPADNCNPLTNNGDFIVNVSGESDSETPDIYIDPASGVRYLYLDVITTTGGSENGYELWAGPPVSVYKAPPNVNGRNMWSINQIEFAGVNPTILDPRESGGVQIFGLGHLPMNSNATARVEIPLTDVSGVFEGSDVTIEIFDSDSGASGPFFIYFDSIPKNEYLLCWGDNDTQCENEAQSLYGLTPSEAANLTRVGTENIGGLQTIWGSFTFTVPTDELDGFYGGTMIAGYGGGSNDTFGWKISVDSRPYLTQ